MNKNGRPISILYADDEEEDRQMAMDAWQKSRVVNDLNFVEDGKQLMDYLYRRKKFAGLASAPPPGMILPDYWLKIVELPAEDAEA